MQPRACFPCELHAVLVRPLPTPPTRRFITGSYDRTCKVWDTKTGEELLTLEGHKNVVYAIAFNNPFG